MSKKIGNTFGIISVLIASAVFHLNSLGCLFDVFCTYPFGISIIAVIFGILGMKLDDEALMGKVGVIIGIIETVIYFLGVLINIWMYYTYSP